MRRMTFLICILLLLSGCAISFEEPENLITAPASNYSELKERELITSFLADDENIQIPRQMENPAASIDIDIDNDGTLEKLVFWGKKNGYQTGITLLKKNKDGKWGVYDQEKQSGKAIIYFKELNLTRDDKNEILIGVDAGGNNALYIYGVDRDGLVLLDQLNYSRFQIVDLDKDQRYKIINVLNNEKDSLTVDINIFSMEGKRLKSVFHENFAGFCQDMKYGKVAKNRDGLYLALSSDTDYMDLRLFLYEDGAFYPKASESTIYTTSFIDSKRGMIYDVNGDGIIDILKIVLPTDASKRPPREYLQVWNTWNEDVGFQPVYAMIENKTDGYKLNIPLEWLPNLRYQYYSGTNESQLRIYDNTGNGVETQPTFTIYTVSDQHENIDNAFQIGKSNSEYHMYLAKINTPYFSQTPIDEETLRKLFETEGGS